MFIGYNSGCHFELTEGVAVTVSPTTRHGRAAEAAHGHTGRVARLRRLRHFVVQYLRNPRQIGAIAPSSPALAAAMTLPKWFAEARTIVELGPGDGPVTAAIRQRLNGHQPVFFALEINETMCRQLRERFSDLLVYCDSAARIGDYLQQNGRTHADCVISSIPWAAFDAKLQKELMGAVLAAMRPGARFVTFTYVTSLAMPSGRRFRRFLDRSFASVTCSPVIWRNLPPAVVYECVKG